MRVRRAQGVSPGVLHKRTSALLPPRSSAHRLSASPGRQRPYSSALPERADVAAQHWHTLEKLQQFHEEIPEPTRAELQELLDLAGEPE